MNQYVTGTTIKQLRENSNMTQAELAEKISVSPIAKALSVSITELFSGNAVTNMNVSSNMLRSKFYVCPVCGNVIHSMGESVISCHGVLLTPLEAEDADPYHNINIEGIEDEYYVTIDHEMSKTHYISFIAAVSSDRIQMVKLFPEGNAEARFKMNGVKRIYFYCNRDGLKKQGAKEMKYRILDKAQRDALLS